MKSLIKNILTLAVLLSAIQLTTAQTSVEEVGLYDSQTGEITFTGDESTWKSRFEERLGNDGATVTEIYMIGNTTSTESKFLVVGSVINDPEGISSIGWELDLDNGIINFDNTGGGIEHTCTGDPCDSCKQDINWKLEVYCTCIKCNDCNGRCNHSMKVFLKS